MKKEKQGEHCPFTVLTLWAVSTVRFFRAAVGFLARGRRGRATVTAVVAARTPIR